jgi:hypothetical protein
MVNPPANCGFGIEREGKHHTGAAERKKISNGTACFGGSIFKSRPRHYIPIGNPGFN